MNKKQKNKIHKKYSFTSKEFEETVKLYWKIIDKIRKSLKNRP